MWAKDRKCVSSCLIILEQKKLKDRHGMVEVLDRPAYFNCCTGVLNEEAPFIGPLNAEGIKKRTKE